MWPPRPKTHPGAATSSFLFRNHEAAAGPRRSGATPAHAASAGAQVEALQLLGALGADLGAQDEDGFTLCLF